MAAARQVQQEPAVKAATADLMKAMETLRSAMVARDPALAPVIAKIPTVKSPGARFQPLTPLEREQLNKAYQSMHGTPEEMNLAAARARYREVMRQAILAAAPGLATMRMQSPPPRMLSSTPHRSPASPAESGSASPAQ